MVEDFISDMKDKFLSLQNRRWITSFAAFVVGVVVLVVYFQAAPSPELYTAAEEAVSKWKSSEDDFSYSEMRSALRKVPALERKYSPIIAQKLFERNRLSDALALAHQSLKAMEADAPYHAAYGETTLLIEQGSIQEALEKSVGLKEWMTNQCNLEHSIGEQPVGGALLFAHNLLRIASLQKELRNRPGEKAAWEELESFLNAKESLTHLVFDNFRDKGLDLAHYITERKKQL